MTDILSGRNNAEGREADWASRAVVAANEGGRGCVLWYTGESLRNEIEEAGLRELADLGLDDAPIGISIWEGSYVWVPGGYEQPEDGYMAVSRSSAFRRPSQKEWAAICAGRSPWASEMRKEKVSTENTLALFDPPAKETP